MTNGEVIFIPVTDDSFEREVIKCSIPILIIFGSETNGGSYITLRQVSEVIREYEGRVKVGKMEAETNPVTARQYRIRQIPTLLFFKNGQVVDYLVGTVRKSDIRAGLRDLLEI